MAQRLLFQEPAFFYKFQYKRHFILIEVVFIIPRIHDAPNDIAEQPRRISQPCTILLQAHSRYHLDPTRSAPAPCSANNHRFNSNPRSSLPTQGAFSPFGSPEFLAPAQTVLLIFRLRPDSEGSRLVDGRVLDVHDSLYSQSTGKLRE